MTFNYADLAVVLILLFCVLGSRRRGITYFVMGLAGNLISLFLSVTLYGRVTALLRKTPLFGVLYERIRPFFSAESIGEIVETGGAFSESEVVKHILANDNSEIYSLFGVDTFADYVSSYIANIALNIVSIIAVYVVTGAVIKLLFHANVVFSGMPGIKQINFITGVLGGLIEGVLIIWLAILVVVYFALSGSFLPAYEALLTSGFAIYFYKYNVFMYAILSITA